MNVSDLYSIGCTAFELITVIAPWSHIDAADRHQKRKLIVEEVGYPPHSYHRHQLLHPDSGPTPSHADSGPTPSHADSGLTPSHADSGPTLSYADSGLTGSLAKMPE